MNCNLSLLFMSARARAQAEPAVEEGAQTPGSEDDSGDEGPRGIQGPIAPPLAQEELCIGTFCKQGHHHHVLGLQGKGKRLPHSNKQWMKKSPLKLKEGSMNERGGWETWREWWTTS
ncbi:hypothetical protein JD844_031909 [Phrynosoma platyrhinos]|uniref:Uncharacterized protein n=1 Tax=Phrynosoma platyrhinos TaxID=52577 RepID=A0ABQ7T4F1_PHRPL|nr:hypothetical protein JD844_031909 [Phrynosoma platyrhinos]